MAMTETKATGLLTGEEMTKQPTMLGATKTALDVAQRADQTGTFGPGVPLQPLPGQVVRVRDFGVSENTVITPRAYETSTKSLRAYANVEIIRLCIETRKDQMEALSWSIKPKAKRTDSGAINKGDPKTIAAMQAFWESPDGVHDFATWLRMALEDLLVLDAPAFERRRTLGGGVNGQGKLLGLDVIPGDTIHPLIDATGRRPVTGPAYQQVIKGRPWVNLTNADLLYLPRNPRPGHNYGMGPVEQIIVTINTFMRRQAAQLAYFTEGNTPAGLISGPDGWTADQIRDLQDWLDARLSGSTAEQAKLLMFPSGAKYQGFKDSPLKDEFDEWLARVACFAFSLPPTPFIKAMNKSTAETDKERAQAEGLLPLRLWFKRLADRVMKEDFGIVDHEWSWDDDIDIDPNLQSQMDDRDLKNGSRTHDEIRERRGDAAYADGIGAKPMLIFSSAAMLVEDAILPPVEPPAPIQIVPNADGSIPKAPPTGKGGPPGGKTPSGKPTAQTGDNGAPKPAPKALNKAEGADAQIDVHRPVPRRAINGLTKSATAVLQAVGDDVAVHVARSLRALEKATKDDATTAADLAAAANLSGLDALTGDAFDDLFDVVVDSATAGLAQVGVKVEGDLVDRVDKRAVEYAKARAADMVSVDGDMTLQTATRTAIRDLIVKGLADNIGTPAIAKSIQESRAFSAERASTIAFTEVANANSQGVLSGFKMAADLGVNLQKGWQTSNAGSDTCDDCVANEAQGPIDLDEDFQSGDDAPTAHPGCECVLTSVLIAADGSEEDQGEE